MIDGISGKNGSSVSRDVEGVMKREKGKSKSSVSKGNRVMNRFDPRVSH